MSVGMDTTAVPTTVHCDHLVEAQAGGVKDLARAVGINEEVFDFLATAAAKVSFSFYLTKHVRRDHLVWYRLLGTRFWHYASNYTGELCVPWWSYDWY